ncbi:MAG: zinc metalloprotease [Marmoricola sp.]
MFGHRNTSGFWSGSFQLGRRWSRPVAVAAAVAVIALGAPGSVATSATASPDRDCDETTQVNSRVTPGATHGSDPNSVTPARAAAMDRALQKSVSRLKKQGTLNRSGSLSATAPKVIRIRTHVHVITRTNGTGNVPTSRINAQIKVLNDAYAGKSSTSTVATPFQFDLASVDVTKNNNWYDWNPDTDNDAAKKALHRGGYTHLNLYIASLSDGLLGYATFPTANDLNDDGVVILNNSLPGGSAAPFNLGDTATHEVGHWLGLFHTFQGGCTAPGDHVQDTPYQADGDNIFYCDASDNTCTQPGKDPVHNYMSYGDDPCLNRFTAGQVQRMSQSWFANRSGK